MTPISHFEGRPAARPANPNFSSGPCAKRPGWSLDALADASIGRSHRAKGPKAKLQRVIEDSRTMVACLRGNLLLPLMPRPLPLALVDVADRLKPQTHGAVFLLKGKVGNSLMGDTQFIPKIAFFNLRMLA